MFYHLQIYIAQVLTLLEVVSKKALCRLSFSAKQNCSLPISSLKWVIMFSLFPSKFFKVWTSDISLVFSISLFFKWTCNSAWKCQEYSNSITYVSPSLKYHCLPLTQTWLREDWLLTRNQETQVLPNDSQSRAEHCFSKLFVLLLLFIIFPHRLILRSTKITWSLKSFPLI